MLDPAFTFPPLAQGPLVSPEELASRKGPVFNRNHKAYWYYGKKAGGFDFFNEGSQPLHKFNLGYLYGGISIDMVDDELFETAYYMALHCYEDGLAEYVNSHYGEFIVPGFVHDNEYEGQPLSATKNDPRWRGRVQILTSRYQEDNAFFFMALDKCNQVWPVSYPADFDVVMNPGYFLPMRDVTQIQSQSRSDGTFIASVSTFSDNDMDYDENAVRDEEEFTHFVAPDPDLDYDENGNIIFGTSGMDDDSGTDSDEGGRTGVPDPNDDRDSCPGVNPDQ